jgi:microcystin degradation protein MlrC
MKIIILAGAAMFTFSFSAMAVAQGNDQSSAASEAGALVSETAKAGEQLDLSGVSNKAESASVVVEQALGRNPAAAEVPEDGTGGGTPGNDDCGGNPDCFG